ncbi:LOW QUALITY PROTEIN: conserved hypothetical protein, partial [Brucella sp. 83/13]
PLWRLAENCFSLDRTVQDIWPGGDDGSLVAPRQMGQDIVERILHLRRQCLTGKHIAMETGVSSATVSRILRRAKLSRMKDIDPIEPVIRYEYAEPGGLIHLDIKRLGRFERVGHRITGNRTGQSNARGLAGNMSMSASMMLPASPSPTYSRMKKPSAP